jgi:hypothetical protein
MNIRIEKPPNNLYNRIIALWPEVASQPYTLFTWGDTIYATSNREIPPYTMMHEEVHSTQQKEYGSPQGWWDRYLTDPEFRLAQELAAYRREYRAFLRMYKDKNTRDSFLRFQALMLSSPMYGNLISFNDARKEIQNMKV